MRFAFADSRPSVPSSVPARRITHFSQRMPLTWIVSVTVATDLAYRAAHELRGRFQGGVARELEVGLTAARVDAVQERLAAQLTRRGPHERKELGGEIGRQDV